MPSVDVAFPASSTQEIAAKYPAYLERHRDSLPPAELAAYERQYECIRALCTVYETEPQNFQRVMQLLTEMQECGAPPPEIVADMSEHIMPGGLPGLGGEAGGLPPLPGDADPSKCCIQ